MDWVWVNKPDFVLLMAGTNDIFQGVQEAELEARMNSLENEILARSPGTTIILSTLFPIVMSSGDPASPWIAHWQFNERLLTFNNWLRASSADRLAHGQPVYLADNYYSVNIANMADGFHPKESEYRISGGTFGATLLPLAIDHTPSAQRSSYALPPTFRNVVGAFYQGVFRKPADPAGYSYWLSVSNSLIPNLTSDTILNQAQARAVAGLMIGSQAAWFSQTYGGSSNYDFVQSLYQNITGAPGDVGGANYWTSLVNNGGSRSDTASDLIFAMMTTDLSAIQADLSSSDFNAANVRQKRCFAKVLASQFTAGQ